jgi:hypothetical protein
MFYFHPKTEEELLFILKHELFAYPVFFDKKNELDKLNNLPTNPLYQCFLLDKNNNVLIIGNPVYNQKIWELYQQTIIGEISENILVTTVDVEQTKIELKDLKMGNTTEIVFMLKNTGAQPMIIQMVETSCGCTVANWEKQPIDLGENTKIKVKITPEEKGYFNKTITVHCNTEEGRILLKISGMVE